MSDRPAVVLVRGGDPGLVRDAVEALVARLSGGDPFAVEELPDDAPADAVVDACQTPAMLSGSRVVVAREAGRFTADSAAPLVAYVRDPNPTTSLVLVAGGGTLARSLADAVRKAGEVVDAGVPGGRGRAGWLAERVKESGLHLDRAAVGLLDEHLGEDLGRVGRLLEVLAAAHGPGARLGADDVAPFLGEAGGVAPWGLTDAIDAGDAETALDQLRRMLGAGERHPFVVMATLQRHYESMLRLDGADVADAGGAAALLGMAEFPARKALAQARHLGSAGVSRAITLLADADLALRGATGWPEEVVLEVLVARLSRLAPRRVSGRR